MKTITTILLVIVSFFSVKGQAFPDKIRIVQNTYEYSAFIDTVKLYSSDTIVLTNKSKISKLFIELERYDSEEQLLNKFEIDIAFIRNNPDEVLKLYDGKEKFDWNEKQKEYILKKLNDATVLIEELNNYISNYRSNKTHHRFSIYRLLKFRKVGICGMGMPTYRSEYVISIYREKNITNIFTSRRSISGYNFPYKDQRNRVVYNYKIDKQLNKIFKRKIKIEEPLTGNNLLKYIVNQIVDNNIQELYKLSGYSYENEISELSTNFKIISTEEVYGRGRYIWNEPKTIKITLKNEYMLPNVYLQFLASTVGKTIYSRDSIKKDYKNLINRVQSISFIMDYLKQAPDVLLHIYYFNNSGINQYNIDGVNKNPLEWKKQDDYIESLKWDEKHNIKPSFDINEAIKVSERNHCGCNYRFDNDFIKKAIFLELTNSVTRESSVWLLLPDNRVLLYIMQGNKVLNYDYKSFGKYTGIQFPCVLFTSDGKIIENK